MTTKSIIALGRLKYVIGKLSVIKKHRSVSIALLWVTYTLLIILFSFSAPQVFGQENLQFKAFGHTPNTVNDSLYSALKSVKAPDDNLYILYRIGQEHITYGNPDSVIYYGHLIEMTRLEHIDAINEALYLAKAQQLLGEGKYINGLYDESLKAFIEGITAAEKVPDTNLIYELKLGLGKVYLQKKMYPKAIALLYECAEQKEVGHITANANYFLGIAAFRQEKLEDAKSYFEEAFNQLHPEKASKLALEIDLAKGELAFKESNYDSALELLEDVIKVSLKQNYFDLYTEAVLLYGSISRELGHIEVAEMTLSMAYVNAMQWNRLELQKKISNSLRLIYAEKEDYKNAYSIMTQYNNISDEILEQQNSKAIQELEFKYQTLQKENQIFQLKEEQLAKQNEIERQKTIKKAFLYGFLALLIPIIALLFVYYQKLRTQSQLNIQQKELNTQKIASLLNEQELRLAKTALNAQREERHRIAQQLHDGIGGNLAGIKLQLANLDNKNKLQQDIMNQVNETYELVRDISHDLIPKKFNQNAFTILIAEYVEKIKGSSKMEVTFLAHPPDIINNLGESLKVEIYQIIQELFTNAIKHANAKAIELHLTVYENVLHLLFEDDGVGFLADQTKNGIGLTNIKNRLKQLNADIHVDSALGRGTVVTIEIPIKTANDDF